MELSDKLLSIIGPTGSGKSAMAMEVARRAGAEILSVDAMQIYQGMNIGTAKPTPDERKEIRHHLLDWVRPDETFSVARFFALANQIIADAKAVKMPLIAVGGTPLYFKSLFYGLFEGPSADLAIREELGKLTGEELHSELTVVDPIAAARIHAEDRKRLIRALEIFQLTGKPISSFQTDWENDQSSRFPTVWIGLRWETLALNRRINARVKEMISTGWLDEVRKLSAAEHPWSQTAAGATGYQFLFDHLNGKMSLDEAIEQIKISTRQLARRQMKWFRRFPGVHWLEGDRPLEENAAKAIHLWKAI